MGLIIGGVSASDLILDGRSVSLYVGGNPPTKVWPTRDTVQITLGTGFAARDQLRAALSARGMDYRTVTEIPFDIELVGTGTTMGMFSNCSSLTSVPAMDTSQVTNMSIMFSNCSSLTSVPAMDTSQVTNMSTMFAGCEALTTVPDMDTSSVTRMSSMFESCSALTYVPDMYTAQVTDTSFMFFFCTSLTDGNVRLIGRNPNVSTENMIGGSGLTREPFYDTDGHPIPTAEVHQVSVSGKSGSNTAHSLVTVTVPAGETWSVRVQGTMRSTFSPYPGGPQIRIGSSTSSRYGNNASVDYSGTITSTNRTIALVTPAASWSGSAGFTGTVTIEK